jgi:hypothetical protein
MNGRLDERIKGKDDTWYMNRIACRDIRKKAPAPLVDIDPWIEKKKARKHIITRMCHEFYLPSPFWQAKKKCFAQPFQNLWASVIEIETRMYFFPSRLARLDVQYDPSLFWPWLEGEDFKFMCECLYVDVDYALEIIYRYERTIRPWMLKNS